MLLLPLLLSNRSTPTEFFDYLRKPDSSYRYVVDRNNSRISLTSQTWQGREWQHEIWYRSDNPSGTKGTCVLFVNGGHGSSQLLDLLSPQTRMPTAVLYGIPNQPLYGGLTEDDLIAYTFQKYLDTHDASWPLLFPMTKSVLRAMDSIEAASRNTDNPIHRFIISGASKRGWTTWLTAASKDPRVIGIAPMVIDNLNLGAQMKAQIAEWGKYSDQIIAYSKTGLLDRLSKGDGIHLAEMVDPYTYRKNIKVPTLIVKGANDPFWTVDAMDRYWSDLHMPKWVVTVPNAGHNLAGGAEAAETLGAFARSVALGSRMPKERWSITHSADTCTVRLHTSGLPLKQVRVWVATSQTLDFRPSPYSAYDVPLSGKGSDATLRLPLPPSNVAVFGEATYTLSGKTFRLCSPTKLIRFPR